MILDLSVFQEETLDITIKFRKLREDANAKKVLRALNEVTALILNSNTDGVYLERETIDALSVDIKLAIVNAYTKFILKLQANPT